MDYLTKAGISSLIGSFLGNYAIRGFFEGKPLALNIISDSGRFPFLRSSNHDKEKNGYPSLRCNMNDAIAMGVGTVVPLLISGFLKTTLRDSDTFHGFTSGVISGVMTACFEYNDRGLKK